MANHVHMLILRVSKPSQFVGDWVRDWLGNRFGLLSDLVVLQPFGF